MDYSDKFNYCLICKDQNHKTKACPSRSKFKNSMGKWHTRGLFREQYIAGYDQSNVIYTLYDHHLTKDGKYYPSIYLLYMNMEDLTEWEFAHTFFDGWEHWQQIANASWMKEYILRYRTELELKLKASALRKIMIEAEAGKDSYKANMFLIQKGWIDKQAEPAGRRGRPSKAEVERIAKEEAYQSKLINEDLKRLGIN